jgi:magnesium chelatase family protein
LAKSVVSILPPLNKQETIELTKIYSVANLLNGSFMVSQRPFRSPHHSSSEAALLGGGSPIRPGEITLSHRGVLFLDEFPEFHRDVLESLRQPLEEGVINIQRAKQAIAFPAKFMLIASANPCPCGFYNDPEKQCSCLPGQIHSYQRKLSGPLIDRFDLFCFAATQKYEKLTSEETENSLQTKITKEEIEKARAIQKNRFSSENILTNSEMTPPMIKKYCHIGPEAENILRKCVNSGNLSGRGLHKILKLSRTIADLSNKNDISLENVLEAVSYRQK